MCGSILKDLNIGLGTPQKTELGTNRWLTAAPPTASLAAYTPLLLNGTNIFPRGVTFYSLRSPFTVRTAQASFIYTLSLILGA